MLLDRWLRAGPAKAAGQRLYAATVAAARAPELYHSLGAPDTPDGRFELYTLHVLLVLERLRSQGEPGRATAQALFDAYLSGLDNGLRELAVGDLSVAKTMRKLGEASRRRLTHAWPSATPAGRNLPLCGRKLASASDRSVSSARPCGETVRE